MLLFNQYAHVSGHLVKQENIQVVQYNLFLNLCFILYWTL